MSQCPIWFVHARGTCTKVSRPFDFQNFKRHCFVYYNCGTVRKRCLQPRTKNIWNNLISQRWQNSFDVIWSSQEPCSWSSIMPLSGQMTIIVGRSTEAALAELEGSAFRQNKQLKYQFFQSPLAAHQKHHFLWEAIRQLPFASISRQLNASKSTSCMPSSRENTVFTMKMIGRLYIFAEVWLTFDDRLFSVTGRTGNFERILTYAMRTVVVFSVSPSVPRRFSLAPDLSFEKKTDCFEV